MLRWFSDDRDLLVFYNSRGEAVPITRAEQDQWIAQIDQIAENYVEHESGSQSKVIAIVLSAFFGVFVLVQMNFPIWLITPMMGVVICVAASFPYFQYGQKRRALFQAIETKTQFRDPVILDEPRRGNFFGRMHLILVGLMVSLILALVFFGPYIGDEAGSMLVLIVAAVMLPGLFFQKVGQKVDKKHIARTGNWFRDWF